MCFACPSPHVFFSLLPSPERTNHRLRLPEAAETHTQTSRRPGQTAQGKGDRRQNVCPPERGGKKWRGLWQQSSSPAPARVGLCQAGRQAVGRDTTCNMLHRAASPPDGAQQTTRRRRANSPERNIHLILSPEGCHLAAGHGRPRQPVMACFIKATLPPCSFLQAVMSSPGPPPASCPSTTISSFRANANLIKSSRCGWVGPSGRTSGSEG